jgi:CxxC motif-containing protein
MEDSKILSVKGNTCARGDVYARQEVTDPRRVITTTIGLMDGGVLPVKSDNAVSKNRIPEFMHKIHDTAIKPPVQIGDVLIPDIDGEGSNIVATQNARA